MIINVRIIENNYKSNNPVPTKENEWLMTCEMCGSVLEAETGDTYIGALGCRYVKCPCCGAENMLDDGIVLTKDNLLFPEHYFSFRDGVKLTNKMVDKCVKNCIEALRNSTDKNFYATRTGSGDTHVFVFKYDGDEEYYVYVGKGGYETLVPFEDVDYK